MFDEDVLHDEWFREGIHIVADYDYSDAPDWANERSWYIRNQYELEYDEV